jgi:ABC-2 type transport system ATP-binding protein
MATIIELAFNGPAPDLGCPAVPEAADTIRLETSKPEADLASLLSKLGEDASRLRSVEVLRPSLETVFLALTGRRYTDEVTDGLHGSDAGAKHA